MAITQLDVQYAYEAQQIGQQHRGWLIMWSLWHRTFTAFSCFAPTPVMVEAATGEQLVARLRQIEIRYAVAPIDKTGAMAHTATPTKASPHA